MQSRSQAGSSCSQWFCWEMVAPDQWGETSSSSIPVLGMSVCVQALVLWVQGNARRDGNSHLLMDLWTAHKSVSLPNLPTLDTSWSMLLPQEATWALAAGELHLLGFPELWSTSDAGFRVADTQVCSQTTSCHTRAVFHIQNNCSLFPVLCPSQDWCGRIGGMCLMRGLIPAKQAMQSSSSPQTSKRTKL